MQYRGERGREPVLKAIRPSESRTAVPRPESGERLHEQFQPTLATPTAKLWAETV